MKELSLHLLDIIENSISAQASNIFVEVKEDTPADTFFMKIQDDGKGMDSETAAKVMDPFFTSRTTRKVGLGIPLLKAAAETCNGFLTIQSEKGKGTCIEVQFQHSHIDRMPLGDLAGTVLGLVIGSPQVHWQVKYTKDDQEFLFDDEPIKAYLEGIPLTEPEVIHFLRDYLRNGLSFATT